MCNITFAQATTVLKSTCLAPTFLLAETQSSSRVKLTWQGTEQHLKYHVQYKKKGVFGAEWFSTYTVNTQTLITDLESNVVYEFRVGASCDAISAINQSYVYSSINEFTLPANATPNAGAYNCGLNPSITIANQTPLTNLIVTETFTAGDFPVKVLEVTKSGNTYTGKGYVTVPYLLDTKIAVVFKNITINTSYQLINGTVETTYRPDWANVSDIEDLSDANTTQTVPFPIVSVTVNSAGDIVVEGANGELVTYPGGSNTVIVGNGGNGNTAAGNGNIYAVDGNGTVTGPMVPAPGGIPTPQNTTGVTSNGQATAITSTKVTVSFEKAPNSVYAYDAKPDAMSPVQASRLGYTILGTNYLKFKAVENQKTDKIIANFAITDTAIKPDSIVFKTQNGVLIPKELSGNKFILTVKGYLTYGEEQVLATVKEDGKWKVINAFNLVHIAPKTINVVLVPLNGRTIAQTEIAKLKNTFKPAAIDLNVTIATQGITYNDADNKIQTGDSDILAVYTDEQQTINAKIKALSTYSATTYYLIYSALPSSKPDVQGFMALKGQFGYVFTQDAKTPAHELGHGIFGLEHPFSMQSEENKSSFLMDKNTGITNNLLSHNDWKQINDPKFRLYLFQSDSEGEFAKQFAITPNFKFVFIEKSHTVNAVDLTDIPIGTLPGFISEDGKKYIWSNTKLTYVLESNGDIIYQENGHTLVLSDNLGNEVNVWLLYNLPQNCNGGSYMSLKYKDLKTSMNANGLIALIYANQSIGKRILCEVASPNNSQNKEWGFAPLNCEDPRLLSLTNAKVLVIKTQMNSGLTAKQSRDLLQANYFPCVFERLDIATRKIALNNAMKAASTDDWEFQYTDAATGIVSKDKFYLDNLIISTSTDQDRKTILLELNNNKYLYKLFDKCKSYFGISPNVGSEDVIQLFINIGIWAKQYNDSLEIIPATNTDSFGQAYKPADLCFMLGEDNKETVFKISDSVNYTILDTDIDFDASQTKITLRNKYTDSITSHFDSYSGTLYETYGTFFKYEEEFNPYELILFRAPVGNEFGLEPKEYRMPAITALALQWAIIEKVRAHNLRQITNGITIIAGVAAAPFTGGESLVAAAAIVTTAGVVVGGADFVIQEMVKNGTISTDSPDYKSWNELHTAYGILDGFVNITSLANTGLKNLATLNTIKNTSALLGLPKVSGLGNFVKTVLKSEVGALKIKNFFEIIKVPALNLKSITKATVLSTILSLNVGLSDANNLIKISRTFNTASTEMSFIVNANKVLSTTAEVAAEITTATPSILAKLNTAEEILVTTANGSAQASKVVSYQQGLYSIFAHQIQNSIVFTVIKSSAGATSMFQETRPTNSNGTASCSICIQVQQSDPLCNVLESLKQKHPTKIVAISKLCQITNLLPVATKIRDMDVLVGAAFLDDINDTSSSTYHLSNHIANIDTGIIDAWKIVRDARPNLNYRKDWEVLQVVKSYSTSNSISYIGSIDGLKTVIEKNETAPCNVCANNNDVYIYLDKYLDYVHNYTNNYTTPSHKDYEKVLGKQGIKSGGIHQINATAFILRVLKENPNYKNTITGFEEKIETINDAGETNKAFADIVENGDVIIECKSWLLSGFTFQKFVEGSAGSVAQFKTYLSDANKVTSINKIEYWFDKKKLNNSTDATPVKEKFKQMLYNGTTLTTAGNAIFEAIWSNSGLRENLFANLVKLDAKNKFIDLIKETSNNFYNFIKGDFYKLKL